MLPAIAAATERRADRFAGRTDLGPPSRRARQPGDDDRPPLQRADGARARRRLADQRAQGVRHRTRAAGPAGAALRGGDPDHPRPDDAGRTTFDGRGLLDHRRHRRPEADPVAAPDCWSARPARACCGSPPVTPTSGTRGATSRRRPSGGRRSPRRATPSDATRRSMHTSVQALVFITESAEAIERARTGAFADRTLAGSASADRRRHRPLRRARLRRVHRPRLQPRLDAASNAAKRSSGSSRDRQPVSS